MANAIPFQILIFLIIGGITAVIYGGPGQNIAARHKRAIDRIWREGPILAEISGVAVTGGSIPGLKPATVLVHFVLTDRFLIILDDDRQEIGRMTRRFLTVARPDPNGLLSLPVQKEGRCNEKAKMILRSGDTGKLLCRVDNKDNTLLADPENRI